MGSTYRPTYASRSTTNTYPERRMSLFGGGAAAASSSNPTQGLSRYAERNSSAVSDTYDTKGDLSKDVQVQNPPEDSISAIRFSPVADYLAASSWDKKVRIYEVDQQGNTQGRALFEHEGPVLDCCWSKDGQKVFGAGTDKAVRMLDLGAGATTATQVAAHDAPIRCVDSFMHNGSPMLISGSWDKMIKYWDLRQQQPIASLECKDRVYTMDVRDNQMLVVGTAERWIHIVDLKQPTQFFKLIQSPLKWQTRVVSTFTDGTGFAVGSIEGRCAIQYVEDKDQSNNFSFKCHRSTPNANATSAADRNTSNVFAVNAISFHPNHGTFSTAGSDGTFHFWDKDAKHRLKGYPEVGGTISATDFSHNGNIFGYAVSYDWSKGYSFNTQQLQNKIMLHPVGPEECKPRPKGAKR